MNIKENVSKNLRKFRKERKIKQKELGELIGVQEATVSMWETGKNSIDIETLYKISRILKVSINELIGLENEKIEPQIEKELNKLNNKGKEEAKKRIKELTYIPEYTEEFLKENNIS